MDGKKYMHVNELDTIMEMVLAKLAENHSSTIMSLWFNSLVLKEFTGSAVVLSITSEFKKSILEQRYSQALKDAFRTVTGLDVEITIYSEENPEMIYPTQQAESTPEEEVSEYTLRFKPNYTFDNFVVGKSNELAHRASYEISKQPAMLNNPLFIYGPSGLGKTHLLFAIVNEIRKNFRNFNIIYVTSEEFTNELVHSLAMKEPMAFREKYRNADVLLVDDVQFLEGKISIQEEFFHTFNTLFERNKQVILAADCHPHQISNLEQRLTSRFSMGLVADIQPPDLELRIAIFKRKSSDLNLILPTDVLTYLAENIKLNIRQIEGTLKKLNAHSFISGKPITLEMTKEVLFDFLKNAESSENIIDKIFAHINKRYGFTKEALKSEKRNAEISYARHIAIYLTRQLTSLSQKGIAKIFSRRDHTTVYNSILVVERKMKNDPTFEREINKAIEDLK